MDTNVIVTLVQSVSTETLSTLKEVLPVAAPVAAFVLAFRIGWKQFKRVTN